MSALDGIATLALSLIGIGLALWDFFRANPSCSEDYDAYLVGKMVESLKKDKNKNILEGVLKDYEVCQAENQRRDNITLLIGSIFVTGSLLVMANTILSQGQNPISVHAFVSIGIFSLWLFIIHDSSNRLDEITYHRIHSIERALTGYLGYGFGIHSQILDEVSPRTENGRHSVWWLRNRRKFWSIVLLLLSLAWMFLSLIELHTK